MQACMYLKDNKVISKSMPSQQTVTLQSYTSEFQPQTNCTGKKVKQMQAPWKPKQL